MELAYTRFRTGDFDQLLPGSLWNVTKRCFHWLLNTKICDQLHWTVITHAMLKSRFCKNVYFRGFVYKPIMCIIVYQLILRSIIYCIKSSLDINHNILVRLLIHKCTDNGKMVGVVLVGFKKVPDLVGYQILLSLKF